MESICDVGSSSNITFHGRLEQPVTHMGCRVSQYADIAAAGERSAEVKWAMPRLHPFAWPSHVTATRPRIAARFEGAYYSLLW